MERALRLASLLSFIAVATILHAPAVQAASAGDSVGVAARESYAVTPDGIRIYYRVAGNGPETVIAPFALFHGNALDALAKGRRVVTYDPRGRGKSQAAPLDRVSLDYLLSDLETVRSAVGAEKVAIVGWSGSGMETFVYALRNPARVSRLVQLAPVTARAEPYTDEMGADRRKRTDGDAWNALQTKIKAGDFAENPAAQCRAQNAVDLPAMFADKGKIGLVPNVCESPNEHQPMLGKYFGALWPDISKFDWRSSLERVTIPRLIIYPLQDNISRAGVEEWVRGQSNARILYVEGSGHFPLYEQPNSTLNAIETFLGGAWPEQARSLPAG
jgi:pimeloyl-ACP methyl ester carboxylesterase